MSNDRCKHCETPLYHNGFEFEPCDCYGAENERLEALNAELVEALESIEWCGIKTTGGGMRSSLLKEGYCFACGRKRNEGHLKTCSIGNALRKAGKDV